MPESQEQRDSAVVSSAGEPGPLSRLLQELADASSEDALDAWKNELQPGDRLGRFEIRREVGRGGFGAVYEAFDTELNRVVAVKTLRLSRPRRDLSSDWIKKEAEAVARLDHPCIVTLHDVGTSQAGPYLVMELLHGNTLAQRIAEGPIPQAEALRIAEEMAKGLAHAHQRGVLHRDLKPANVFVCEDGRVKLLDFGLAHLLGTEGISGAGTPKYMAPEQARGEEVDQRADVYAAGRVLGDMLGGRRPRRLERAIALATSPDPAARPRDGQAWLEVLQEARHATERPARMGRVAVLAGLGVVLGGVVVGVVVHRAGRSADAARAETKPSVAVLPFVDMSPGKDLEYFGDGIAEEILNTLAQVKGLKVIGRTSSFSFKGKPDDLRAIGQKLNVETLLEGSVRKEGGVLRISAQLIRAADGAHLWSQAFDRGQEGLLAIQKDIAQAVATALQVNLLPDKDQNARWLRTDKPEAYAQLLLGRHFAKRGTMEDHWRAMAAFEKAVALDPGYAAAWAGIVQAAMDLRADGGQPGMVERGLAAAEKAVALAPDLPQSYRIRGLARWNFAFDRPGSEADFARAAELRPKDASATGTDPRKLNRAERIQASIASGKVRVDRDPLDPYRLVILGRLYMAAADFVHAREALGRALELSPGHMEASMYMCMSLVADGLNEEALAFAARQSGRALPLTCTAEALHGLRRARESQEALDTLIAERPDTAAYQIAQVYAWRGEADRAFEWLEHAFATRDNGLNMIQVDPLLRGVHGDPRYTAMLKRLGLEVD